MSTSRNPFYEYLHQATQEYEKQAVELHDLHVELRRLRALLESAGLDVKPEKVVGAKVISQIDKLGPNVDAVPHQEPQSYRGSASHLTGAVVDDTIGAGVTAALGCEVETEQCEAQPASESHCIEIEAQSGLELECAVDDANIVPTEGELQDATKWWKCPVPGCAFALPRTEQHLPMRKYKHTKKEHPELIGSHAVQQAVWTVANTSTPPEEHEILEASGDLQEKVEGHISSRSSGVRGVRWNAKWQQWVTATNENGKWISTYFPVRRHRGPGVSEEQADKAALDAAIAFRRSKEPDVSVQKKMKHATDTNDAEDAASTPVPEVSSRDGKRGSSTIGVGQHHNQCLPVQRYLLPGVTKQPDAAALEAATECQGMLDKDVAEHGRPPKRLSPKASYSCRRRIRVKSCVHVGKHPSPRKTSRVAEHGRHSRRLLPKTSTKACGATSGAKGVYWDGARSRWVATFWRNGKKKAACFSVQQFRSDGVSDEDAQRVALRAAIAKRRSYHSEGPPGEDID